MQPLIALPAHAQRKKKTGEIGMDAVRDDVGLKMSHSASFFGDVK